MARRLLDLALPIIGLNVLNVLALAVDTAMCGRLPEAESVLAALSFAAQVVFLLMVAMLGLTVGSVAFIARAHGAGNHRRVNEVLQQSTQLTLLVGLATAVLGNLVAGPLLLALGAEPEALEHGLAYLRPMLTIAPIYYLSLLFAAALRGVGNTRLAFFVALVINGLNAVLNYGLILGNLGLPALGIRGAAYGTAIAYTVGVALMVLLLALGMVEGVRPPLRPRRIEGILARELFGVGWPAALDMLILNASFLSLVAMLGRLDGAAVAAHGVGLRIQSLAFMPGLSIGQATGALVGQRLGAMDEVGARRVFVVSVVIATAVMATLAVTIVTFVGPILALFDVAVDGHLGQLARTWIFVLGMGLPIVGPWMAMMGLFRGAGATRTPLRINAWSTFALQIPLSWLLGFPLGLGPLGVWLGFPVSFALKALMGLVAYRRGAWVITGESV